MRKTDFRGERAFKIFPNILTEHVYMDQDLINHLNKTRKIPLGKQRGYSLNTALKELPTILLSTFTSMTVHPAQLFLRKMLTVYVTVRGL